MYSVTIPSVVVVVVVNVAGLVQLLGRFPEYPLHFPGDVPGLHGLPQQRCVEDERQDQDDAEQDDLSLGAAEHPRHALALLVQGAARLLRVVHLGALGSGEVRKRILLKKATLFSQNSNH